jgi:hypothetical protein
VPDCPLGYIYCPQLGYCVPVGTCGGGNGQSGQWTFQDATTGATATFTYNLIVGGGDTTLQTSMTILDGGTVVNYGTLNLHDQNVRNKNSLSAILSNRYTSIYQQYGIIRLRTFSGSIERMLTRISDTAQNEQMRSLVFQSLCMYSTLSKAANRDVAGSGNVNFTIIDGYINGINSFSCEEDEYINIPGFKQYLTALKVTSTNPGIDYYLGALANETAQTLNIVEITNRLETYFSQNRIAVWPQSGECGCCGNNEGPCMYWSKFCLIHDYQCQNCTPIWYCFKGCVPSSCRGNTIAWYWWLYPISIA